MPRAKPDLTRHNIMLFRGDMDKISAKYGDGQASAIIRSLVRKFVKDKIEQETPDDSV